MNEQPGSRRRLVLRSALALGAGAALLWWSVPHVSGIAWSVLRTALGAITPTELVGLSMVWLAGLIAHTFVLTGALPGLSLRRALTLNLTGSAVSNIAPMGGALGIATNLHMTRAWRFSGSAFAVFTLVTNAWDVLAKLALPLVALLALLLSGGVTAPHLQALAAAGAVGLGVLLGSAALGLAHPPTARALARAAQSTARLLPTRWSRHLAQVEQQILAGLDSTRQVVVSRWHQLTLGMIGYVVLQFALFWICLSILGVSTSAAYLLAGFAVERVLTLSPVTPGGTGLAEAGTIATLVALGGADQAVGIAAGVLLYRGFTFLIEIPVGGLWLTAWLVNRKLWAPA